MNDTTTFLVMVAAALVVAFLVLWIRRRPKAAVSVQKPTILIDGSNVMHWQDNVPKLAPLESVIRHLRDLGHVPGVVFDANAGWKLQGRFLRDSQLAWLLGLTTEQVLVVPKGTQADPYLLDAAQEFGVRIVTNDRFRDWAEAHPEVMRPGFLIRGGMRDGTLWLERVEAKEGAL